VAGSPINHKQDYLQEDQGAGDMQKQDHGSKMLGQTGGIETAKQASEYSSRTQEREYTFGSSG
jgi:hypothetical protein